MRLILHIGTRKTGSTSIQFFCKENREKLLNDRILFPETGIKFNAFGRGYRTAGHNDLVIGLKNNDLAVFEELHREIATNINIDKILISSENFFSDLPPGLIPNLKVQFNYFTEVKILIYVRRQDLYLNSLYGEFVGGGWAKLNSDPQEFYLENIAGTGRIGCDYYTLLKPWVTAFGQQNITVRPYEKEQWVNGDLIQDFFKAAELPWNDNYTYPIKKSINISPSAQQNMAIRYLNRIPMERKYYRAAISQFCENGHKSPSSEARQFFVTPALRLKVLQHFNESNVKVAQEFLNREDGKLFYEPLPTEDESWEPVRITDPDLVARSFSFFLGQKFIEVDENFSKCNKQLEECQNLIDNGKLEHESFRLEFDDAQRNLKEASNEIAENKKLFDQLRQDQGALRRELDDTQRNQKEASNEIAENKKLFDQLRQERGALRCELELHSKRLKKKREEIEKSKKVNRQTHQLLCRHVLATFRRARKSHWHKLCRFLRSPRLNEARLLQESGAVDPHYYFENYPHAIKAGITAAEHYVRYGALQGENPSGTFNTKQYLVEHPDVACDGLNPLVHFVLNK